ncbi:MAG TPA: hypothetical protein VGH80_14900 [Xanthomonadaceae bacterium]|jgi:Meckel syndrome type 1 protein
MTQTPQLPPNDPEPLDATERELARMLHNLPSASPPPELDARILGAARRAVQQVRPRKLSWWRSIGMGTAASALIAAGLFLKMHGDGQDGQVPMPSSEPAADASAPATAKQQAGPPPAHMVAPSMPMPAMRSPPPPQAEPAAANEVAAPTSNAAPAPMAPAQPSDAGSLAGKPAANAFPATPSPERGRAQAAGAIEPPPPPPSPPIAHQAPMQFASPAPPPITEQRAESKTEASPTPPRDLQNEPAAAATTAGQDELDKDASQAAKKSASAVGGSSSYAGSAPPGSAPSGSASATDSAKAKNLDTIDMTGSRLRRVDKESAPPVLVIDRKITKRLPPVDDDVRLAPPQWLDRIRLRIKAGDDGNARASLRRFHARYPDAAIPDDLQPLLP